MKITIQIDGIDLDDCNMRSVTELIQQLKRLNRPSRVLRHTDSVNTLSQPHRADPPLLLALRFLRTIRDQPDGVSVSGVMDALRVSSPQAIGGRSVTVNRALNEIGLKPSEVYSSLETGQGRIWKAGAQLPRALAELQKLLPGGPV